MTAEPVHCAAAHSTALQDKWPEGGHCLADGRIVLRPSGMILPSSRSRQLQNGRSSRSLLCRSRSPEDRRDSQFQVRLMHGAEVAAGPATPGYAERRPAAPLGCTRGYLLVFRKIAPGGVGRVGGTPTNVTRGRGAGGLARGGWFRLLAPPCTGRESGGTISW